MKRQSIYPFEALEAPTQTSEGVKYDSFIAGEYNHVMRNRIGAACSYFAKRLNRTFSQQAVEIDGKTFIKVLRKK